MFNVYFLIEPSLEEYISLCVGGPNLNYFLVFKCENSMQIVGLRKMTVKALVLLCVIFIDFSMQTELKLSEIGKADITIDFLAVRVILLPAISIWEAPGIGLQAKLLILPTTGLSLVERQS